MSEYKICCQKMGLWNYLTFLSEYIHTCIMAIIDSLICTYAIFLPGSGGSWSCIGTIAKDYDTTMVLNLSVEDSHFHYQKHVVIHEFGHALGLGHENQMSHIASELDESATIKWLQTTCKMSEKEATKKFQADYKQYAGKQIPGGSLGFDPGSIMCYP